MKAPIIVITLIVLYGGCNESYNENINKYQQISKSAVSQPQYKKDEILIAYKLNRNEVSVSKVIRNKGYKIKKTFSFARDPSSSINRLLLLEIPLHVSVKDAITQTLENPDVEYAQPNYLYYPAELPNDTYFNLQWGHYNRDGNSNVITYMNNPIAGIRGPDRRVFGADIQTLEANQKLQEFGYIPQPVVVAVVDTGVDYTHEDLSDIVVGGYDYYDGDSDPMDESGHGTHVAGILAGIQNNATGIYGSVPNILIMPIRFIGEDGGSTADAISSINYAVSHGARVINSSWTGGSYETALYEAIQAAYQVGVIFVAAAGNEHENNDSKPSYPSCYNVPNIISVGASTAWRDFAHFSNFGRTSVHIAAPGDEIISTTMGGVDGLPESTYQISYFDSTYNVYFSWHGTSMAAPFVSGAAALLYGLGDNIWDATWTDMNDRQQADAVIARILNRSQRWPALSDRVITSGHLNLLNILDDDTIAPRKISDVIISHNLGSRLVISFTAPGDDGVTGRAGFYKVFYQEGSSFSLLTAQKDVLPVEPGPAGSTESIPLGYYHNGIPVTIGVVTYDNAGNGSLVSNLVTYTNEVSDTWADDMEDVVSDWVGDWSLTAMQAYRGKQSITDSPGQNYSSNEHKSTISPEIITNADVHCINLYQQYDFEAGYDFGYIEVRWYNQGTWTDWLVVATVSGTQLWHKVRYNLPGNGEKLQLRLSIETDASINHDGWYIDEIQIPSFVVPNTVLFADTFDQEDTWNLSEPWTISDGVLRDGGSGQYANNIRASVQLKDPVDLRYVKNAHLEFDLLSADYEDGWDFLFLEYSLDEKNWLPLKTYTGTYSNEHVIVGLVDIVGLPHVYFRFRNETDPAIAYAGAEIDNVVIYTAVVENQSPQALPQAVTVLEDSSTDVYLLCSDAETDSLSFMVTEQPYKGSITGSPPHITYSPDENDSGSDAFWFRCFDGVFYSNKAKVTVMIVPQNDQPSVVIQSPQNTLYTVYDQISFTAIALDVEDGDISENIQWSSSIIGSMGIGTRVLSSLPEGNHTIIARIHDSQQAEDTDMVMIEVVDNATSDSHDSNSDGGTDSSTPDDASEDQEDNSHYLDEENKRNGCDCRSQKPSAETILLSVGLLLWFKRKQYLHLTQQKNCDYK